MSNNGDNWFDEDAVKKDKPLKQKKTKTSKSSEQKADGFFSKFKPNPENKVFKPFVKAYGSTASFTSKHSAKVGSKIKDKPLMKKILYTLMLILIFRIAATITIPGIHVSNTFGQNSASLIGVMDMMGGGALKSFSIVALGISPYITASIIMQLLQSEVFPPLYRLSQSGPAGKRKINIITRIVTLVFAFIQAITIIQSIKNGISIIGGLDVWWFKYFVLPIILISGSMFALFLGEQITNNGVGNGTSLIIFSGIASTMPLKFRDAFTELVGTTNGTASFTGAINFILYLGVFLLMIYVIGIFYKAERQVPIQQTGSGLTKDVKQMSKLPIKLNPAGVMPVIFAMTITMIPLTVVEFFNKQDLGRQWIQTHMLLTAPLGLGIFIGIVFLFTIVMSLVTFNPAKDADSFKKNWTFIPGILPGEKTEKYLTGIILRLSIFSSIYLAVISSMQYIEQIIGLSKGITFGGTSLIILVSVAIETTGQLKARSQSVKIAKAKTKTLAASDGDESTKGLLW